MAWMKARVDREEPFFAYLPTNAPHAPLWVPSEDREALEAAFAAGKPALLRGELIEDLPEGFRGWLVEQGHLEPELAMLGKDGEAQGETTVDS